MILNFFRMDYHKTGLEKACRVCGKRLHKAKGRERSHLVQDHISDLAKVFRIDASGDRKETHPTSFCYPCLIFMRSWHKREAAVGRVFTWTKHIAVSCKVSSLGVFVLGLPNTFTRPPGASRTLKCWQTCLMCLKSGIKKSKYQNLPCNWAQYVLSM